MGISRPFLLSLAPIFIAAVFLAGCSKSIRSPLVENRSPLNHAPAIESSPQVLAESNSVIAPLPSLGSIPTPAPTTLPISLPNPVAPVAPGATPTPVAMTTPEPTSAPVAMSTPVPTPDPIEEITALEPTPASVAMSTPEPTASPVAISAGDTTPPPVPYHPQKITYALTESFAAMPNPGKGWVAYVFDLNNPEAANMGPLVSTLYTNNVSWGDLEPEKGQYRWDKLDRLVQMAKRNGIKFRFSLNSVDPTTACPNYRPQIPYWYLVTYPSSGRWINTWYGNPISSTVNPYGNPGWVFEPDYASAAYTSEYFRFLTALASYWRSNPDWMDTIEGMEISNYGLWGEWHSDFPWTSPSVKASVLSGMVDWYFALFPEARTGAQPRMEISALFTGLGESGVSHAVQMGADMARKCMGICFHGYISQADYDAVNSYRFWRSFRGEWGSWTGAIDNFYDKPNGSYVTSTKGAIDEALYNFKADRLGWYVHSTLSQPSGVAGQTFAEYFQSRSGYRLYVSQVSYPDSTKPGETFTVDTQWYQRGVSKLYLPSKFAVDLDGGPNARYALGEVDFDATNWQLGPQGPIPLSYTFKIPNNIPPGRYDVRIGLVDSKRRPMINLANAGKESSNPKQYTFYAAGAVEVLAK